MGMMQMAVDQNLVKDWIQYLKNNKIVALQSDPESGRLKYIRQPTSQDLERFLQSAGIDAEKAKKAIAMVMRKKPPVRTTAEPQPEVPPTKQPEPQQTQQPQPEVPPTKQPKPHYKLQPGTTPQGKPKVTYKGLKEEIQDQAPIELSEKDIERVFSLLAPKKTKPKPQVMDPAKKQSEMNKLRRIIRDTMTPQQRQS